MKKILMVEDDEFLNKVYEFKLTNQGFEVYHATRGDEVQPMAEDVLPDLIILDIILPGLNGFEVLKALKESNKTKDIPVIALTNLAEESDKHAIMQLGAKAYLTKTDLTIDQVLDMIRKELATE